MVGVAAHAVIHTITAERPKLLGDPRFVSELVTLLENYLSRPQAFNDVSDPTAGG